MRGAKRHVYANGEAVSVLGEWNEPSLAVCSNRTLGASTADRTADSGVRGSGRGFATCKI